MLDEKTAGEREARMWGRVGDALVAMSDAEVRGGGRILLVRSGPKTSVAGCHDAIEKAVRAGAAAVAKGQDTVITAAVPDAAPPPGAEAGYPVLPAGLSPAWLDRALRDHAPVAAVVSLVGEPAQSFRKGTKRPPFYCYAEAGERRLAEMIRAGVVAGAVAPRHDPPPAGEKDWFSIRYTVVTSANVEQWAPGKP